MMRPLASIGATSVLVACSSLHDAAPIEDPTLPSCVSSGRYKSPIVYQESQFVRAYFEPANLEAYRRALAPVFSMPPRPMVRVSVLDFYEMVNGPTYLESEISVLALYQGEPGWFVLTMPVTDSDACALGRRVLGTPKVMRRITLEQEGDGYKGVSYALGGRTPEFTLRVSPGAAADAARTIVDYASPIQEFHLLRGRVVRIGGLPRSVVELAASAPGVWSVRVGEARLDYPREAGTLLQALRIGEPLGAYWGRLRYRFSITPR
jgi:hypothetical protein